MRVTSSTTQPRRRTLVHASPLVRIRLSRLALTAVPPSLPPLPLSAALLPRPFACTHSPAPKPNSMRRILERLWASAQERIASLPNAPRLLAQARASLGMPPVGDPGADGSEDVAGVTGAEGAGMGGSGRQGSRGMREELSNSKRRQQQQHQHQHQHQQLKPSGAASSHADVGAGRAEARGEDEKTGKESAASAANAGGGSSEPQRQKDPPPPPPPPSSSSSQFLDTYVFLEEFLKELFCALSVKNGVETDAQGLSESHRRGSAELLRTWLLSGDGEGSPKQAAGAAGGDGGAGADDRGFGGDGAGEREGGAGEKEGGGGAESGDLPTSLDEFLREAAFPTFASPPLMY